MHLPSHPSQALEGDSYTLARRLRWWCRPLLAGIAIGASLSLALAFPLPVLAKTFHCGAGDVRCLVDAIDTANANGTKHTIRLEAGTYTLTAVDDVTDGANGLPSVTSTLTIRGGADATILERDASAPPFRLFKALVTAAAAPLRHCESSPGLHGPSGCPAVRRSILCGSYTQESCRRPACR
jgi:hypothetical protein